LVALALRLAKLKMDNGDKKAAVAAQAPLKLPNDLCMIADPAPRFMSAELRAEDYPSDLIFSSIVGVATIEYSIEGNGQVADGRVLVSLPPFAFDQVTLDRAKTIRYDVRNAKKCRAEMRNIVWQLP
jgi:outer membrane biosynthesis protein TonB